MSRRDNASKSQIFIDKINFINFLYNKHQHRLSQNQAKLVRQKGLLLLVFVYTHVWL